MPVRLLLAAILAIALAAPAGADAHPKKPFHVSLSPAAVAAGATVDAYTVTLTNKAHPQKLGSANVTVPAAFAIVGEPSISRGTVSRDGNLLKLRNLDIPPYGSATVTLGLQMPCARGDHAWAVEAKQANDFHGSGNSFGPVSGTLSTRVEGGGCRLRFVDQPASAERGAQIRADAFQPASAHLVSVEAVDGSGRRLTSFAGTIELRLVQAGPGSLSPNPASSVAVAGLASFSNLAIDRSGNYNLRATTAASGGFEPAVSERFQVIDVVEPCTGSSCTATLAGAESTSTVTGTGGSGTGVVLLSLNLGREPVCAGYAPAASDWYEFEITVPRDKTVKAAFGKAAVKAIGGVSKLQICFAAPTSFPAKGGAAQPFDYDGDPGNGAEGFVGLLPNCGYKSKTPCILKRECAWGGGAVVKFFVPAAWGDPRYSG